LRIQFCFFSQHFQAESSSRGAEIAEERKRRKVFSASSALLNPKNCAFLAKFFSPRALRLRAILGPPFGEEWPNAGPNARRWLYDGSELLIGLA
jgi:hypothetical protein